MKILVISAEVWRDDTNGGNVLSNIFSEINAEFAQIYCNPGNPINNICKKYYQITDNMVISNILKKQEIGRVINFDDFPNAENKYDSSAKTDDVRGYKILKKYRLQIFYAAKELAWKICDLENDSLKNFITIFSPDIIFAPCYASHKMLRLTRFAAELTNKPVISYISDDNYSLKQFHISPIYWLNRLILRHNMRKTFPYYSLVYTMTEEQKAECEKAFNANMKILRKTGVPSADISHKANNPIKLIFAGGIYCGRWKTLACIVRALKSINKNSIKAELHIYTGNELSKKQRRLLDDGINSYVHGVVSQGELKKRYSESDIALHVESFDIKNRLLTRLSFSTKIVDCLESGCAVMAIAWKGHSGIKYLQKEDAAICITKSKNIFNALNNLSEDIINKYKEKAQLCLTKNHDKKKNDDMICSDFEAFAEHTYI